MPTTPTSPTTQSTATPQALRDGADSARALTADVLQSAEEAVESTRSYANHQLDRAHDKVRDLRGTVEPAIDRFAARAQDVATRGIHAASDASAKVHKQINHYAEATGRYVAEQPVKSVLIAAVAGAALAALVMSARRNHTRY